MFSFLRSTVPREKKQQQNTEVSLFRTASFHPLDSEGVRIPVRRRHNNRVSEMNQYETVGEKMKNCQRIKLDKVKKQARAEIILSRLNWWLPLSPTVSNKSGWCFFFSLLLLIVFLTPKCCLISCNLVLPLSNPHSCPTASLCLQQWQIMIVFNTSTFLRGRSVNHLLPAQTTSHLKAY